MHRPPTAEAELAAELAVVRPALGPRFAAELPGARAAVLTRLWRGLAHEPLPWIAGREEAGGEPGRGSCCCGCATAAGCAARARIRTRAPVR